MRPYFGFLVATLVTFGANASAQEYTSTIYVDVWSKGIPVADAFVVLIDDAGGFQGFGRTNSNGRYTFYYVPSGNYTLKAFMPRVGRGIGQAFITPGGGPEYVDIYLQ
jgi:hypothetical protein